MNQQDLEQFFDRQMRDWPLAAKNFDDLKRVQVRSFQFDGFAVRVQFNAARAVSSCAKTDAASIAARPCFLCTQNRPAEQAAIDCGDWQALVNPFPIFPKHFTIVHKQHQPQDFAQHIADFLQFTHNLPDYVVFYNGPRCGASAPDHLHFQAGNRDFLPLVGDYFRLKSERARQVDRIGSASVFALDDYLRTVFCIEGKRADAVQVAFLNLYNNLIEEPLVEPMMNIVGCFENDTFYLFVMPRKAFRPWQYSAEDPERQLLISPAAVEMAGVFVTPVLEHFQRITADDVVDIFAQISKG